jgi:phosphonate transport system substrate-binding protein
MTVGTMSSGDTAFAVNVAGGIPFGIRGDASGPQGYQLWMIVKKSSPYQKLSDLKGKKVAHTTPSSNSGNLAPRALFPVEGLTPEKDYTVVFSGRHENSVTGVASGDYDAAPIAHDILVRMADRGVVKMDDFRIIWKSPNFAPGGLLMAHDLVPALQKKVRDCTYAFRFPPRCSRASRARTGGSRSTTRRTGTWSGALPPRAARHSQRDAFEKEKAGRKRRRNRVPLPLGEGRGGGSRSRIVSNTPSMFSATSLFQNRSTE